VSWQELFDRCEMCWGGCRGCAGHLELLQAPHRGIKPEAIIGCPGEWKGTFLQHLHTIAIVTTLTFVSKQPPRAILVSQSHPTSQTTRGGGHWP